MKSCLCHFHCVFLQIKDLEQVVQSLRVSSQTSSQAHVQDIENENNVLQQTVMETSRKVSKLGWEWLQLQQDMDQVARTQQLEQELHHLQEENQKLATEVSALTTSPERFRTLEQESQGLLLENHKVQRSLDPLQVGSGTRRWTAG